MDKVWMTVDELAYKYPSSMNTKSWHYNLLKWRREGDLTTPAHWHTTQGKTHTLAIAYWEVKVLKLIFDNRNKPGFCNLVFTENRDSIVRVLREFTESVRR